MNREDQLACIKERCSTDRLRWTQHIMTRLIQRNISIKMSSMHSQMAKSTKNIPPIIPTRVA